eukprot:251493-Chlamydomonas_euryale.AAC.3
MQSDSPHLVQVVADDQHACEGDAIRASERSHRVSRVVDEAGGRAAQGSGRFRWLYGAAKAIPPGVDAAVRGEMWGFSRREEGWQPVHGVQGH